MRPTTTSMRPARHRRGQPARSGVHLAPRSGTTRPPASAAGNPPRLLGSSADHLWQFRSDDACWTWLRDQRWPGGVRRNPRTGARVVRFKPSRRLWVDAAGHEFSLVAGTTLARSKVPLRTALLVAYALVATPAGIATAEVARQYGLRLETAYQLLARLRAGLVDPDRTPLNGRVLVGVLDLPIDGGTTVLAALELVAGADVQRRIGRVRLRVVARATARAWSAFLGDQVAIGAVVARADAGLGSAASQAGLHQHVATPPDRLRLRQLAHRLSAWLQGTHGGAVRRWHLQAYLNEWSYRQSHRFDPWQAFRAAIGIGLHTPAPSYRQVYGVRRGRWRHANPPRGAVGSQPESLHDRRRRG